jgi:hypothetical protein
MGAIKDVYEISIDIGKFAVSQFKAGSKRREIKKLLMSCLATGSLPQNIDVILDEAELMVGKNEINTRTLRGISISIKEAAAKHKVSAKKKMAAKKKVAAKKRTYK